MRESILAILIIIAVISFFKAGMCIDDKKLKGMIYLVVLLFIIAISTFLNFMLIDISDEAIKKSKGKCPEYKLIENVYVIKK